MLFVLISIQSNVFAIVIPFFLVFDSRPNRKLWGGGVIFPRPSSATYQLVQIKAPSSSAKSMIYCLTNSTRRFFALPPSVSFEATGEYGPTPAEFRCDAARPRAVTALTTDAARSEES